MIIRMANDQEIEMIQHYAPIVQQEATLGYMNGNSQLINYDMKQYYKGEYHILIENRMVCGWILIGQTQMPYEIEVIGMILELYVLPNYRKHGYGKSLMKYALDFLKRKNFKRVQLNVFAGNHAKKLYEKLGFHEVSTLMERKL